MCDIDRFGQTNLSNTGLGDLEQAWLMLVRLCCMSYEHNRVEGWDSALSLAEERFGADDGPAIASRVAALIRAMRAERRGGFGYLSPHCPSCCKRITGDEWLLIQLMQAGQLGDDRDRGDCGRIRLPARGTSPRRRRGALRRGARGLLGAGAAPHGGSEPASPLRPRAPWTR